MRLYVDAKYSLTLLNTKDDKQPRANLVENRVIPANLQIGLTNELMIGSSSLRVIVECNTDCTAMVAIVLPDDQFALKFPESGVVI